MCVQVSSSHVQIRVTNNFRSFAYTVQLSPTIFNVSTIHNSFHCSEKRIFKGCEKILANFNSSALCPFPTCRVSRLLRDYSAKLLLCCVTVNYSHDDKYFKVYGKYLAKNLKSSFEFWSI